MPSLVLIIPGTLRVAQPLFCPWVLDLVDCLCVLHLRVPFSSAIKVQLELEDRVLEMTICQCPLAFSPPLGI